MSRRCADTPGSRRGWPTQRDFRCVGLLTMYREEDRLIYGLQLTPLKQNQLEGHPPEAHRLWKTLSSPLSTAIPANSNIPRGI
jgi:hypothetical protein